VFEHVSQYLSKHVSQHLRFYLRQHLWLQHGRGLHLQQLWLQHGRMQLGMHGSVRHHGRLRGKHGCSLLLIAWTDSFWGAGTLCRLQY